MSLLANYQELQDDVAEWLNRPDLEAQIPTFIRLAEAAMNRQLRTRQMINRARVRVTGRYIKLPDDWRKALNIQRVDDNYPFDYLSPAEMDKMRYYFTTNPAAAPTLPTYYSLFADSLELLPSPSDESPLDVEMLYYSQIRPLSDEDPTNWLLSTHPDIYLYGSLIHSAPLLQEDERVAVWKGLYTQAVAEANIEDMDAKRSGAPLVRPNQTF